MWLLKKNDPQKLLFMFIFIGTKVYIYIYYQVKDKVIDSIRRYTHLVTTTHLSELYILWYMPYTEKKDIEDREKTMFLSHVFKNINKVY